MKHESTKRSSGNAFTREAIAYAVGRTEEWIRQFAESTDLPFTEIACGISSALAVAGNRPDLPLLPLRGDTPEPPEVLQPKVAVGSSARKPVPKGKHNTKKLDGRTVNAIQAALKLGQSAVTISKRLHVSESTVYRYANAA